MSETETVQVGGISLPVTVSRRAGAPLMILTRMASKDMNIWDTIWNDVGRHFTVANFDLANLVTPKSYDEPAAMFRQLAAACAEVATGLGFERFGVLGWNGGTQIAMRCAADFPDRMTGCFLIDPFFELPDMRRVWKAVEIKRALYENPDRELYVYYWVMAGFSDGFLNRNFDVIETMVRDRLAGDKFVRTDPEGFEKWVRALRRNWITDEEFAQIRAQTVILATGLDRWSSGPNVEMAREVAARIGGSVLEVIEGVGGHFLIEDPERFRKIALPHLARLAGGA
ncbi:MAG: alpha/beta fold hydrolase [Flavobacteriaceae bacterium]